MIISFAKTTPALLSGNKTVTRRIWSDRQIALAENKIGKVVKAYDLNPRYGGKHVANIRLVNNAMQGDTLSATSATRKPKMSAFCSKCGAWRGCYGLEPKLAMYVEHTVAIFREVRRVLRKDGTCWVNMGDSYSESWGKSNNDNMGNPHADRKRSIGRPKNLLGIPWRLALALQDDGWYRSGKRVQVIALEDDWTKAYMAVKKHDGSAR